MGYGSLTVCTRAIALLHVGPKSSGYLPVPRVWLCGGGQLCLGWEETAATILTQQTRILREKTNGAKQAAEEANKFAKYHRADQEQSWK